jgi:hypothetical protein
MAAQVKRRQPRFVPCIAGKSADEAYALPGKLGKESPQAAQYHVPALADVEGVRPPSSAAVSPTTVVALVGLLKLDTVNHEPNNGAGFSGSFEIASETKGWRGGATRRDPPLFRHPPHLGSPELTRRIRKGIRADSLISYNRINGR